MDGDLVRERLEELRMELMGRSKRDRSSSRSSSGRRAIDSSLEDVERAMRTLEKGTYGVCEACGRPISEDRLEAYPAARFCREDQQKVER